MGSKSKFIRTGVSPVAICIMSTDLALWAFSASSDEPARGRRVSVLFGICLYLSESCTSGRRFSRFRSSSSVYEVTGLGDQVDKSSCLGVRVYESGLRMGSSRASKNETRGARD